MTIPYKLPDDDQVRHAPDGTKYVSVDADSRIVYWLVEPKRGSTWWDGGVGSLIGLGNRMSDPWLDTHNWRHACWPIEELMIKPEIKPGVWRLRSGPIVVLAGKLYVSKYAFQCAVLTRRFGWKSAVIRDNELAEYLGSDLSILEELEE